MKEILPFLQIIISVFLVIVVLLQQGGAAMGAAFGQGGEEFHSEKRGVEKSLYISTIVLGVVFIALALLNVLL